MPYKNLPESQWASMDRCVEKVQGQGHDKESAIAICYTSISGKEYQADPQLERVGNQYRVFDANNGATYKQVDSAREAMTALAEYKATADINNLPDSAFLHVEAGGEKDDSGRTVPRDLRHLPYKNADGSVDLPHLRNALSRLGQTNTGTAGGDKWLTESLRKSLQAKAQKILADHTDAASAEGKEAKPSLLQQVISVITGKELFNKSEMKDRGRQIAIDSLAARGVFSPSDDQIDREAQDLLTKDRPVQEMRYLTEAELRDVSKKEGRRNSNTDAGRLQKIHDLSVENGAACPMVFKEASGRYRWVLFSTNSYEDSDKEIVSQKALEDDVTRMDASKQYGPLRWWHVGQPSTETKEAGPGLDIGDCDYSAMLGRIGVESGTFRNERIGEAIKQHAAGLKGSIGFFHPMDQPDATGTYQTMYRFERSLLPAKVASNQLTALPIITKENEDMATQKEKVDELTKLLGGDVALVGNIVAQAEATEKAAQEKGLKFKQTDPAPDAEPAQEVTTKAPSGEPTAVPAHGMGGLMSAFGLEPDDDEAKCKEKIGAYMSKMIDEHMGKSAKEKERTEKEIALNTLLEVLKEATEKNTAAVKELQGDLPRGFRGGFRASQADTTILNTNFKAVGAGDPLDSVIDQLMGKGQ